MNVRLNAYLSFRDNAREALEFYRSVFGGKLTLSTFGESHVSDDPAEADKIMHGELDAGDLFFMAADTPNGTKHSEESNISMSLSGTDKERLTDYFNKLGVGGVPSQPLVEAPWGDTFGMLTDRFGTFWMVNITASKT